MPRPPPRILHVKNTEYVSPNMLRVTLGGPAMLDFPRDQASAYIKLLFPSPMSTKPLMRTYSIRAQRRHELDIDFVIHSGTGPAASWAAQTKIGDSISVAGPGPKKMIHQDTDWFLLAGDMTALPAISVNLCTLSADAKGHAIIEVLTEADIQDLAAPEGISVHWVINPEPSHSHFPLAERVMQTQWLKGQPAIWVASEFNSIKVLRKYFKEERDLDRQSLYISSYWKLGLSEEEHKQLKQQEH